MIDLENVQKKYQTRRALINALDQITLHVNRGEFVAIRGPSGSGKTTLLMTIAGMQRPSAGQVLLDGKNLYSLSPRDRARLRSKQIGFVFQMFHLIPYLNILENVTLAGPAAGQPSDPAHAEKSLADLGLVDRLYHRPAELSAGEKQRAAIARALYHQPKLILADEPTGNLDPDNTEIVLGYLADYHNRGGTVIVVTHGPAADRYANRVIRLHQGRIEKQQTQPTESA